MISSLTSPFALPRAGGDLAQTQSGLVARDSRLRGRERSTFTEMPKF